MTDSRRSISSVRRRSVHNRNGRYRMRMLGAVITSLLLVLGIVQLPLSGTPERIGWGPGAQVNEPIRLRPAPVEKADTRGETIPGRPSAEGAPITGFAAGAPAGREHPQAHAAAMPAPTGNEARGGEQPEPPVAATLLAARAAGLQTRNRLPKVKGGLGNLYLKIDYPAAARRKGIEGRLILKFTVERDGSTSHIRVAQPLHPLLDSSAVATLKRTRFVPGRRNNEPVRVRMRMPVRFELIGLPVVQADARTAEAH